MSEGWRHRHAHGIEEAERHRRGDKPEAERNVCQRRPERAQPVFIDGSLDFSFAALERLRQPFLSLFDLGFRSRHHGRLQLVLSVPVGRVLLEPPYHLRQYRAETMHRLPAEPAAGAGDVDLVVIVRVLDHPGLDLGILVEHLGLHPCAWLGQALGQGERAPVLAVNQPADALLQFAVGERFFLADKEHAIIRQFVAAVDRAHESLDQIVLVQIGLACLEIAAEQIGGREALEDAGDLLGNEGGAAVLVIDPGETEDHCPDRPALLRDYRLSLRLRLRIGLGGVERRILIDPRALGGARRLNQQRARINELLGGKVLQRLQQPARSVDIDGIVFRVVLAGRVIIGGEVNDGSDAPAAALARRLDRLPDARVGGDVEFDGLRSPT